MRIVLPLRTDVLQYLRLWLNRPSFEHVPETYMIFGILRIQEVAKLSCT
jgi:hypothetical protein